MTFLSGMNRTPYTFLDLDESFVAQTLTGSNSDCLVVPIARIHDLVERMNIVACCKHARSIRRSGFVSSTVPVIALRLCQMVSIHRKQRERSLNFHLGRIATRVSSTHVDALRAARSFFESSASLSFSLISSISFRAFMRDSSNFFRS